MSSLCRIAQYLSDAGLYTHATQTLTLFTPSTNQHRIVHAFTRALVEHHHAVTQRDWTAGTLLPCFFNSNRIFFESMLIDCCNCCFEPHNRQGANFFFSILPVFSFAAVRHESDLNAAAFACSDTHVHTRARLASAQRYHAMGQYTSAMHLLRDMHPSSPAHLRPQVFNRS